MTLYKEGETYTFFIPIFWGIIRLVGPTSHHVEDGNRASPTYRWLPPEVLLCHKQPEGDSLMTVPSLPQPTR